MANGRWYVIGGGLLEGGGTFSSLTTIVEAFAVAPASPGNYSVQVSGVGASTGIALVEVYEMKAGQ